MDTTSQPSYTTAQRIENRARPEGLTSPPLKKASDGRKLGKSSNIQSQLP